MEVKVNKASLSLVEGDITKEKTDAIVNAANSRLAGGGGVDGAIHRAGGPAIMEECRKIGGCPTGKAVITTGGTLNAKYVVHTVGPIYRGGEQNEAALLKSAYRESLELASSSGLKSIAFPSISAGAYAYPLAEAASIALETVISYLRTNTAIELVRFVLFGRQAYEEYKKILSDMV